MGISIVNITTPAIIEYFHHFTTIIPEGIFSEKKLK
jgi:hypothetical protein